MVDYLENTLALKLQIEEEEKSTLKEAVGMSRKGALEKTRMDRTDKKREPEEFPFWKSTQQSARNKKEVEELGDLLMEYLT